MMSCQHPTLAASTAYRKGCRCERCKQSFRNRYVTPISYARKRLNGIRGQAKKWGYIELLATPEQVAEWLKQDSCEFCGKPLPTMSERVLHHNHNNGDFIALCCSKCNKAEGFIRTLDDSALENIIRSINNNP